MPSKKLEGTNFCGKGFAFEHNLKTHKRYCVIILFQHFASFVIENLHTNVIL